MRREVIIHVSHDVFYNEREKLHQVFEKLRIMVVGIQFVHMTGALKLLCHSPEFQEIPDGQMPDECFIKVITDENGEITDAHVVRIEPKTDVF